MNAFLILSTHPHRLTAAMCLLLHYDRFLRRAYNARWNMAVKAGGTP